MDTYIPISEIVPTYDPDFDGYQQIEPERRGPDDDLPEWAFHPGSCGCPRCDGGPPDDV